MVRAIFQNEHMKLSISRNLHWNVSFGDNWDGTTVNGKIVIDSSTISFFGYLVPAHEKTCRYKTGNAGEIPSAGNTFAAGPELL